MKTVNATHHIWKKARHTLKFRQVGNGGGQCHIPPLDVGLHYTQVFQQVGITLRFCTAMVLLWLAVAMMVVNATFHHWMKEFRMCRSQLALIILYFCEVMVGR